MLDVTSEGVVIGRASPLGPGGRGETGRVRDVEVGLGVISKVGRMVLGLGLGAATAGAEAEGWRGIEVGLVL